MDMAGAWTLHIKSEVPDTMQHNRLPILNYPDIIGIMFSAGDNFSWKKLMTHLCHQIHQERIIEDFFFQEFKPMMVSDFRVQNLSLSNSQVSSPLALALMGYKLTEINY